MACYADKYALFYIKIAATPFDLSPDDLLSTLSSLYVEAPVRQQFAFHFLILDPKNEQLAFCTCGLGSIYHITGDNRTPRKLTADNPPIGTHLAREISMTQDSWHIGDTLLLHTFQTQFADEVIEEEPAILLETILENSLLAAQSQADGLMKQLIHHPSLSIKSHPKALICLQRID